MTTTKSDPPGRQDLVVANLDWVRALSRKLVSDAATADDLVQRAWLIARQHDRSFGNPSAGRAWLAGIIKNLARDEWRRNDRRKRRELAANVEREHPRAPDDLLEQAQRSHELASLVLELDEPFRRTMLLRWFDGLKPSEIASAEGIHGSTVRTRLHRGIEELRRKLDARHGGQRRDWAMALIPIASLSNPVLPSSGTVPGSSTAKLGAVAALVVAAGGSLVWSYAALGSHAAPLEPVTSLDSLPWNGQESRIAGLDSDANQTEEPPGPPEGNARQDRVSITGETSAMVRETPSAPGSTSSPIAKGLRGVVVLPDGTPVPEVYVRVKPAASAPSTAGQKVAVEEDGTFALPSLADGNYRISVEDGQFALRSPALIETRELRHRVEIDAILAEVVAFDERGAAIATDNFRCTLVARRGVLGEETYDSSSTYADPQERHRSLVVPGFDYVFSTEAPNGAQYSAFLSSQELPGRVTRILRTNAPEFGSLKITVNAMGVADDVWLSEVSARHETRDFEINSKRTRTSDQRLEYPALLPGTYRFEFGLGKASFAGLREPLQLIEIQPGAEHSIELEAFMGGIVQLKVDAPYPVDGSKSASVHFRRRGTEEWQERLLRTESAKYQMREARVLINGPNAASSAWEAGHYEARVMQPGYETAISSFRIMEEKITFVEITLMPEFDQDG